MRRLCGSVDNNGGSDFFNKGEQPLAIADVERAMLVPRNLLLETLQHPSGIAFLTEKNGTQIVIDTYDLKTKIREK